MADLMVIGSDGGLPPQTLRVAANVIVFDDCVVAYDVDPGIVHVTALGAFVAGGDLSGTAVDQTVIGLQTYPLDDTAPTADFVLAWTDLGSGYAWRPTASTVLTTVPAGVIAATFPTPNELTPAETFTITGTKFIVWQYLCFSATGYFTGVIRAAVDDGGGVTFSNYSTSTYGVAAGIAFNVTCAAGGVVTLQASCDTTGWSVRAVRQIF